MPSEKHNEKPADDEKKKKKERRRTGALPGAISKSRMLADGLVLLNRYEVHGLIGGGGFAQIYLAHDRESKEPCAVKIESKDMDMRRMKLEMAVLLTLRGRMSIPEIVATGKLQTGHYLVMQLVGRNLSDIRRQLPHKMISSRTLYRAMLQIVRALSLTHGAGFLHRDLKPSNCCIGTVDVTRIYLIDFGLTRQFLDKGDTVRKPRVSVGMRGTLRYMSLDAHARKDLGPNNDLISFLYTTIELGDGSLPWTHTRSAEEVVKLKQAYVNEKLCAKQPKMTKIAEYIEALNYYSIPDYEKIFAMLEECNPSDLKDDECYDWQRHPCTLEHVVRKVHTSDSSEINKT